VRFDIGAKAAMANHFDAICAIPRHRARVKARLLASCAKIF
jgi:hypothetical protein